MAKVIKHGRCDYHFLDQGRNSIQEENGDKGAIFNSLHGLVPGGAQQPRQGTVAKKDVEDPAELIEGQRQRCEAMLLETQKEVEAMKAEAQEVLSTARSKAAEIESQAYAQGYEQGQKDGEQLGRQQFNVALQHLESVVEDLKRQSASLVSKYEAQMVQISLLVAGKVIEGQVSEDRQLVARVLSASLKKTVEGSSITIHVNPRDWENLGEDFLSRLSSPGGNIVDVRADASVKRGGCLIKTEFGLIDATTESRWKAMVEAINESLKERTGIEVDDNIKRLLDEPREDSDAHSGDK